MCIISGAHLTDEGAGLRALKWLARKWPSWDLNRDLVFLASTRKFSAAVPDCLLGKTRESLPVGLTWVIVFFFALNNLKIPEVGSKQLLLHWRVCRWAVAWPIQARLGWVRLDSRLSLGLRFGPHGFILAAKGPAATWGGLSQQ